ncbi:MAG TPA: TetR family transcriptional regulator [Mycobacteriales bacterium]|jgi:AcrR family transcriptional regulator|nr:TetR family transcriptional regulator [Mycobacteriales bacterium]
MPPGPEPRSRRTGRRPGDSGAREAILAAAKAAFADLGFDGTTVRGIARTAEVDPALVHHYFGTKERLFVAAMELPVDPAAMIAGLLADGTDELGPRLVRTFLSVWDAPDDTSAFLGMLRSAVSHERSAAMLREFVSTAVLGRLLGALDTDQRPRRAALVGSQVVGLAMARYVLRLEPLASAPAEELTGPLGGTIQRYLTGPLD